MCTGVVGYNIEFLYSLLGYENQLQKYIVGARVTEIKDEWVYAYRQGDGGAKQSFNHLLQISFHQVLPKSILSGSESQITWIIPQLNFNS